jgi:hypothetical protein
MKAYGGMKVYLHAFLISEFDWGGWADSRPGRFTSSEITADNHQMWGWVDPALLVLGTPAPKALPLGISAPT